VSVAVPGEVLRALTWLDAPPEERLADAVQLLQELGALDAQVW
jgi:HrpA-like RNA helicase